MLNAREGGPWHRGLRAGLPVLAPSVGTVERVLAVVLTEQVVRRLRRSARHIAT
jgi:hypothetical protein